MAKLSLESAVDHLLAAGRLSAADLVDDGIRVDSASGRNVNVRAVIGDGPGWFIKGAPPDHPEACAAVAREGAFYRRAHDDASWQEVRNVVPQLASFDSAEHLLVIELVRDAVNAHELEDASGPLAFPRIGTLLGRALAACHSAPAGAWFDTTLEGTLTPWVLDLATPDPTWLAGVAPSHLKVIRSVQRDPAVAAALDAFRSAWIPSVITHGDLKWGNVLVRTDATTGEPSRLWLVDWECSYVGDPAWDLGSAFHSFLADAVHWVSDTADTPAEAGQGFGVLLPRVQEQIRACWLAYLSVRAVSPQERPALLSRVTLACGARLVQSAYEWARDDDGVPRNAAVALQLASGILRRPDHAARELFALGGGHQ